MCNRDAFKQIKGFSGSELLSELFCDSLRCSWHSPVLGHAASSVSTSQTGRSCYAPLKRGYLVATGFTTIPDFTNRPDILTFWLSWLLL